MVWATFFDIKITWSLWVKIHLASPVSLNYNNFGSFSNHLHAQQTSFVILYVCSQQQITELPTITISAESFLFFITPVVWKLR